MKTKANFVCELLLWYAAEGEDDEAIGDIGELMLVSFVFVGVDSCHATECGDLFAVLYFV